MVWLILSIVIKEILWSTQGRSPAGPCLPCDVLICDILPSYPQTSYTHPLVSLWVSSSTVPFVETSCLQGSSSILLFIRPTLTLSHKFSSPLPCSIVSLKRSPLYYPVFLWYMLHPLKYILWGKSYFSTRTFPQLHALCWMCYKTSAERSLE